ncbi:MAG: hypothetical protein WC486_00500 [Candidatus Omnitrophota bacterium]
MMIIGRQKNRMRNICKAVVSLIFVLSFVICPVSQVFSEDFSYPAEVSGKILNKDGKLFTGEVTVVITANILTDVTDYAGDNYKHSEHKQVVTGGTFSWNGRAENINIWAEKEGYHSSIVNVLLPPGYAGREIKQNDILVYMIPKGTPSTLQYTEGGYIPGKKEKESSGKQCGWSFSKRWYYPVDGDVSVDITRGVNENNKRTYTMKEPGGFIYCPGLPRYESFPDELYNCFERMTEAPEDGYVQSICPSDHSDKEAGDIYYYFKTPDGKYGKIAFRGYIDYYINPDGSRNLETGEVVDKGPRNPIEAEWLDKELGEDN